jgi:RNA polymerase sigma factor (sigma-70 family)
MSISGSNREDQTVTVENFDSLLEWLDPDRARAGAKYEEVRRRLIKIFMGRACSSAEDLADETINRVIKKLDGIRSDFTGDQARYFYAVAHNLYLEYLHRRPIQLPPAADAQESTQLELQSQCLEQCLETLPEWERQLLLRYYGEGKRAKTDLRDELAKKLGISLNALRIRAFRGRVHLRNCIQRCLEAHELEKTVG